LLYMSGSGQKYALLCDSLQISVAFFSRREEALMGYAGIDT